MRQSMIGLGLLIFLALPPIRTILESIMIVHMHMQMPLIIVAGWFLARYLQIRFSEFFQKWNANGIPGILLFVIIFSYWMIPRTMDEALTSSAMEMFKFISLSFLAGVPLRDSWPKIGEAVKYALYVMFTLLFFGMGWLYIGSPVQLCNNYLLIEQVTLGWGFVTMAICLLIYLIYVTFADRSAYE